MEDPRTTEEVERLLKILEERVAELPAGQDILPSGSKLAARLDAYMRFRDTIGECRALVIVIQGKLDRTSAAVAARAADRLDRSVMAIFAAMLTGNLKYLTVLSEQANLPLGSRNILLEELHAMNDAHQILTSEKYQGIVPPEMEGRVEVAERILGEIIARAPGLLAIAEDETV